MGVDVQFHEDLFTFITEPLGSSRQEVLACIDVAFVENLFWCVPEDKAPPYWLRLPSILKDLYVAFHNRSPA